MIKLTNERDDDGARFDIRTRYEPGRRWSLRRTADVAGGEIWSANPGKKLACRTATCEVVTSTVTGAGTAPRRYGTKNREATLSRSSCYRR